LEEQWRAFEHRQVGVEAVPVFGWMHRFVEGWSFASLMQIVAVSIFRTVCK
jgi:hypothetical protein